MRPDPRRLVRAACSLLILLGLGISVLEGGSCTVADGSAAARVTNAGAAGLADADQPELPGPGVIDCCPCIHIFPSEVRVVTVPLFPLVGYPTAFPPAFQAAPDRHPQPLVPPPLA